MVGSAGDESVPMVPRIRQIQIQNYKSIERAVVDLEPFTVFVGANGSGKSNFVDALAFVQECLSDSIRQAWNRREKASLLPVWLKGAVSFGFNFAIDLAEGVTADYAFKVSVDEDERFRIAREKCSVVNRSGGRWAYEVAEGRFLKEIPGIRSQLLPDRLALFAASATEEFRPVYDFLTSMRLYSIDPRRLRQWQDVDPGISLEPDGSNAASVLGEILYGEEDQYRYERIRNLLSVAVPGIQKIDVIDKGGKAILEFETEVGEGELGHLAATEMSDGTLRLLGLLLAIYQPQRPAVLAIEEPEATVHPAAAELVVQVLLDAAHDRQVLITTHSPDILDAKELADAQIRVVTIEHGRTIIAPLSNASRRGIQERLYTPGELLRIDELHQDLDAAQEAARHLDLFGEAPAPAIRE